MLVLGAAGRTERRLLEESIARGHEPVVVLRDRPVSLVSAPQTVAMRGEHHRHEAPSGAGICCDLPARFVVDELECPCFIETAPRVGSC